MNRQWSADDFWQFSIEIYSKEKVQRCCLALQNEGQLNVNLLLLCCWLNKAKVCLTLEQVHTLSEVISDLDKRIQTHRENRIQAKHREPNKYKDLLEQELVLEKQQQSQLIDTLNNMTLCAGTCSNLQTYFESVDWKSVSMKSIVQEYFGELRSLTDNL